MIFLAWFSRLRRHAGSPPTGPADDLIDQADREALLAGTPAVLHRFCLSASAVFRGEARRVLLAIGRSDRQLEEDLSHDMIEVMLRNNMQELRKWRPELGSLRCYLRIVANRRIHDKLRSRDYPRSCERMMEAAELAALPELRTSAAGREISDEERDFWQKYRALFELHVPADQQQLYQRYYVDEEAPEQVAAALGISIDALHKRLSRLRKLLFELRDRLLDEDKGRLPQA